MTPAETKNQPSTNPSTTILAGFSFTNPYLIPTIFIPGRIRDYTMKKYKEGKKEELTKPIEYPKFEL
ncbi:MAG: hypothetical protein QW404_01810 [Candidatus Nanoarchaeia archaeon]